MSIGVGIIFKKIKLLRKGLEKIFLLDREYI